MGQGETSSPRAVLVGADDLRLLALAGELEARGVEVALYRDLVRGVAACDQGLGQVLVALGRPLAGAANPLTVDVPMVLIDVPDAPELPLRPTGPRTVLGGSVPPETVAARVLALLPPSAPQPAEARASEASATPPAGPSPSPTASAAPPTAKPRPEEKAPPASAASGPDADQGGQVAKPYARRPSTILRWVAIVIAGLALGYLVGLTWYNLAAGR